MINIGSKIRLRPNMTYKDDPSKNEDFNFGEDHIGKYQQCQVLDINTSNGRTKTGFFYVRIHTELPLAIDDMVTIKEILYVQRKAHICLFGCTIEENPTMSIKDDIKNDVGF